MPISFDHARIATPFYTEEHQLWRQTLRRFVDKEIIPFVEQWEQEHDLPQHLWAKAAEIGLLQMGYPENYGGISEGIDIFHHVIMAEELSRCGAGGVLATLMVHGIGLPPVVNTGSEALKDEIVPAVLSGKTHICLGITEPDGGSDVANLKTRAEKVDGGYRVTGGKIFITGGMRAHEITTAVRTGGPGIEGISLLLIPASSEGVSRTPLDKKQGWWCSDTASISFDQVFVPESRLIGQENRGFLTIMQNFNHERLMIAASALAYARVCLEEAADWATQRHTFGKPLSRHQVIQHKFAHMLRHIQASTALLDNCAWQVKQGTADATAIALLKVQATQTMELCAREATQILGGMGYMRESKTERIYREVRVNAIGGGSEEIMYNLAASQMGL